VQQPLVSIITQTYCRARFLPAVSACVDAQTYPNIEWLVWDDSPEPCEALLNGGSNRLNYIYEPERLKIGAKRNRLIEMSKGDIILHFDDDDFYGRNYVKNAVNSLQDRNADLALLSGFFVAHLDAGRFGYYRTLVKTGPAFRFNKQGVAMVKLEQINIPLIHLCYGWSYAYKKTVWDQIKFLELNVFEDREFVSAALKAFRVEAYECRSTDCIHSVHSHSSSQCFPQFLIPRFVMRALSTEAYEHMARLRDVILSLPPSGAKNARARPQLADQP
jgi:glycosyltransferase involved in cell wall biosynthesis